MNPEKHTPTPENQSWEPEQPSMQPAAYDVQGRPLYYAPPTAATAPIAAQPVVQPQTTATSQCSPLQQKRHEYCKNVFPDLDLNQNEYVLSVVKRHPLGIISIWASEVLGIVAVVSGWIFLVKNPSALPDIGIEISMNALGGIAVVLVILFLLIGWVGSIIFNGNRFYLTNERIVQFIMPTLFSTRRQTITLSGVEDVSYSRAGIIQTLLNFGSIRMSTIGDENTYRFSMVDQPERQTKILNSAVQAAKKREAISDDLTDIDYSQVDNDEK